VVGDRRRVASRRVTAAVQTDLLWRGRERPQRPEAACCHGEAEQVDPLPTGQANVGQVVAERERGEHVTLDIEVTLDVRTGEPELTRCGQHSLERGGGAHHQGRAGVGRTHAGSVMRLDRDGQLGTEKAFDDVGEAGTIDHAARLGRDPPGLHL